MSCEYSEGVVLFDRILLLILDGTFYSIYNLLDLAANVNQGIQVSRRELAGYDFIERRSHIFEILR